MKKTITSPYDVAEHLRTPKEMALYLQACIEESNGDAAFIAKALGDIARAKGMAQVAKESGLSRESLYKALSAGAKSILIDNFNTDQMKQAVAITAGRALLEASGGINLDQMRAIASTGVDRISLGKLTKDVNAVDFSMRIL